MKIACHQLSRLIAVITVNLVITLFTHAAQSAVTLGELEEAIEASTLSHVRERYNFFGLASYYNSVNYYLVDKNGIEDISLGDDLEVNSDKWLAIVGRFKVLVVRGSGFTVQRESSGLIIERTTAIDTGVEYFQVLDKTELADTAQELNQIRYAHLWMPLAWLTRAVDTTLVFIQGNVASNWGVAILVFAILIRLFLFPLSVMAAKSQRRVSQLQSQLSPILEEIKAHYDGEEAHNKLMAAYKSVGVSPFFALRPMLVSLIQIPLLIAIFNALGEMPQLDGASFLWITNLAYPDAVAALPYRVPMMGQTLSFLPFLMTFVTVVSTLSYNNSHAPDSEAKRQKRHLYYMAAVFFVLFYPFPAAMVLFWMMANFLQALERQFLGL